MRALLFDYPGSKLQQPLYAISMRMSYLLCNQVVYAGKAAELYNIIHKGSSLSAVQKAEALKYGDFSIDEFAHSLRVLKEQQKKKYRDANALAVAIRFERALNDLFDLELQTMRNNFYKQSFMQAENVCDQPGIFKRLLINKNPERSEKNIPAYSDWLLLNNEETERDIVILPEEFFMCHKFVDATNNQGGGEDEDKGFVDHCISLPLLGHSTMEEMECIRNYASSELEAFKEVMNRYIDMFVETDESVNRLQFFEEHIKPVAETVNKKWQQSPLMADLGRRCKGNMELQVWLGELPVQTIWNFYKEMDVIPPVTWNRLQEAANEDERLQGNWPVIMVHVEMDAGCGDNSDKKQLVFEKRRTIKI